MSHDMELFEDRGILTSWTDHPNELVDRPELDEHEPATPLLVSLSELLMDGVDRSVDLVRRHKKTAAAVGGTALGGIGFATGATIFSHRHAH